MRIMYNSIMQGLKEAVDDSKGKILLKSNLIEIESLTQCDEQKTKGIRSIAGMSSNVRKLLSVISRSSSSRRMGGRK